MNVREILVSIFNQGNISDLHFTINQSPIVRLDGQLKIWPGKRLTYGHLEEIKRELLNREQNRLLDRDGEVDFSWGIPNVCRFRVNAYYQKGNLSFALRIIPFQVIDIDEIGIPPVIKYLAKHKKGLILLTGPTGCGKSTTLASILDYINRESSYHVITLEDPIEYLHRHKRCLIHQREIGTDTGTFTGALRVTLRQDPDIVLVGEMRDQDTISLALEVAETGHLVFGTLHTREASQAVDRIIDAFSGHRQQQTRVQLASVLSAIITQWLVPKKGGGRVASFEILLGSTSVKKLIREGKTHQIPSAMELEVKHGMQTMDQGLLQLFRTGKISRVELFKRCKDIEEIKKALKQGPISSTELEYNL